MILFILRSSIQQIYVMYLEKNLHKALPSEPIQQNQMDNLDRLHLHLRIANFNYTCRYIKPCLQQQFIIQTTKKNLEKRNLQPRKLICLSGIKTTCYTWQLASIILMLLSKLQRTLPLLCRSESDVRNK